jgi:hypothetical protein
MTRLLARFMISSGRWLVGSLRRVVQALVLAMLSTCMVCPGSNRQKTGFSADSPST